MALPNLSFVFGVIVLLYLSTFVLFAILRILTGVSIQRIGFSSLRRIAYNPKDGIKLEIRGLGFQVHRPTFAQPTWFSLVISELVLTLDLIALRNNHFDTKRPLNGDTRSTRKNATPSQHQMWKRLMDIKEKIKSLHAIIPWLRLIDVIAQKSSVVIAGVGTAQVGNILLSVDTRRHTIDRSRIFLYKRPNHSAETPVEWTLSVRSILFTPEGRDSLEILDHCVVNVHGFLQPQIPGLRDASIFIKAGRVHVPYDDLFTSLKAAQSQFSEFAADKTSEKHASTLPANPLSYAETIGDQEVFQSVSDAKDFVRSVLRGIREVSFAISFVGFVKRLDSIRLAGAPVHVSASLKELGLDLYRLDPTTPAQAMYFSRKDTAHQALLSAISLSVGVDDGSDQTNRILYVPMTTATIKTTLPAKILQIAANENDADRNTNVVFANLVVTSPSVDLDPHHLPFVLAVVEKRRNSQHSSRGRGYRLVSALLPKATIKCSIHEPVVRVALPSVEPKQPDDFTFDLLISSISSISLDIESSHSPESDLQYLLSCNLRVAAHRLYYQTVSKRRHELLISDSIALRAQVSAAPDVQVAITGDIQTFTVFMLRPEINDGLKQIIHQLRAGHHTSKLKHPKTATGPNFMRKLPRWLQRVEVQASDFNVEIAGKDEDLSERPRGFALHLESLTTEYKINKDDTLSSPQSRRRGVSKSSNQGDDFHKALAPAPSSRPSPDISDRRRLAVHAKGFEAFIIEGANAWEQTPFISLARAEIAFTSANDGHGPVFHINSLTQSLFLEYSLFKHYCVGVAFVMLRRTFTAAQIFNKTTETMEAETSNMSDDDFPTESIPTQNEFVVLDAKLNYVQVKARLPTDPNMMLQIHELEVARHRFTNPNVRAQVARLHVESPAVKKTWNRLVSIKSPRLDVRENRRKHGSGSISERSFDFVSEAIRIGVPHQLIVHKVFDNFVNTVKTAAQLHHRFQTASNEYILAKQPEKAKHVPKISIRSRVLLFELEDGAFEWKLGVIFRAGVIEQQQRDAREEAFRLKCRKMQGSNQNGSAMPRQQGSSSNQDRGRSASAPKRSHLDPDRSASAGTRHRSSSPSEQSRSSNIRYDRDYSHGLSNEAGTSNEEAWEKLQKYNAQSWKKRVDRAMTAQHGQIADLRALLWGLDNMHEEPYHNETILKIPQRAALMTVLISDLNINIDKPSFPLIELPDFLHRIGKGLPKDTLFSLLVPLSAHFDMGECRMSLRDYPLPLLHIPAIKPGQSPRLPSWSLKTDFVIAEEFRDYISTRDLQIMVVPPEKLDPSRKTGGFAVDVRRTVSPVKTYSDMKVDINTARDTRITWGSSYQPAIQDMMQVIEGFTKPQVDPSDRVGFWDKIRLSFHSRVNIAWKGDGDVHLNFKGSRDPYLVTGHGAGLMMIWRNNVRWNIWQQDDPCKFMTVDSGDYVLAIPDFGHYARQSNGKLSAQANEGSQFSTQLQKSTLKKVVMKLSGKVRWQAGLVFERNLDQGGRSFDFEPHYNVTLRNPAHVKNIENEKSYDAFRGFRSHHIHMSIAISAPSDREWSPSNVKPASSYNAVHLTPRFFTHFFAWWAMFSGVMSLPIHQGSLFPGIEKSGKKFGRHLATIKYSLLLSPLFISHVYKHKDAEDFSSSNDTVSATGLKLRLDSFMLDLHQRREEFESEVKGLNKTVKTSGMRINQALLDLVSADIRALSSTFTGTSVEAVKNADKAKLFDYHDATRAVDLSAFNIPDNDFSWIDVDDFVEIDWSLPTDSDPETKILPLAYAPRFTYRRQTDHNDTISGNIRRHSPFGYEATHNCIMSAQDDSRRVQIGLIQLRLDRIEKIIFDHKRSIGEQELRVVQDTEDQKEPQKRLAELREHGAILARKQRFLRKMIHDLDSRLRTNDIRLLPELDQNELPNINTNGPGTFKSETIDKLTDDSIGMDGTAKEDNIDDFSNRFVIHNAQIKWNNSLRNIMLRYIHQVSQRRGFVYYTSRRAVKFILDIVEEQRAKQGLSKSRDADIAYTSPDVVDEGDDEINLEDRIQELLDDGKKFVNADDPESNNGARTENTAEKTSQNVSHDFLAQSTYHVRLVGPQVQLQSEKNTKSAVLVTARGMRLKVVQIMDKDRLSDDVSGLVQRRFSAEMDNMQFFVTSKHTFSTDFLHMYSGNPYGSSLVTSWPPWVPVEVMFDFGVNSYGFARIAERTSASARYDTYNKLRLKYNDNVSGGESPEGGSPESLESRMDHLWVDFPRLRVMCDSTQYFAMYVIVLDLLMYSEPLEKTRSERLEKIMLASDFSDLRGAPEIVVMLQERIRQLEEIKTHFHVNEKYLDRQGWQDRIGMEQDLTSCEDELFFIMKAITTSQSKPDERNGGAQVRGLLKWYLSASEIVWHLTRGANQPLVEFQLRRASYERTDNSDGSNNNSIGIDRIHGLNLLPNALYPEIIAAYTDQSKTAAREQDTRMFRVKWHMLEAIAGIPVVDHFEVNLHPLKVQLEYETGKRLFEYIFPGRGSGEEGSSPFMVRSQLPQPDENEDEEEAKSRREFIKHSSSPAMGAIATASATGAGSLESRLQPTHHLPDLHPPPSSSKRPQGLGINSTHTSYRSLFHHSNSSRTSSVAEKGANGRQSAEVASRGREITKIPASSSSADVDKRARFTLTRSQRSTSNDSKLSKTKKSDDLTQMLNRASNYMTLAYAKIPSVVLCLSYKGKGSRNFEDVHNLVFRMPTIEYRNKTWSNLDLALALKRDVIRALISHTGTILSNKFVHHKPGKHQQNRLRALASSSVIMSSSPDVSQTNLEMGSNGAFRAAHDELDSSRISDVTDEDYHPSLVESYASSSLSPTVEEADSTSEAQMAGFAHASENGKEFNPRDPLRSTLSRHFSELTHKARRRDSIANEDAEETNSTTSRKGALKKLFNRAL